MPNDLYLPPHRRAPWDLPLALSLQDLTLEDLSLKSLSLEPKFEPFKVPTIIKDQRQGRYNVFEPVTGSESEWKPGREVNVRGRGEVRAPPAPCVDSVPRILGVIEERGEEEEEDLDMVSAHYSHSTTLVRDRKPAPLADRISRPVPPPAPTHVPAPALVDRIGPLYIPPIRRHWPHIPPPPRALPPLPLRPDPTPVWKPTSNKVFRSPALSPNWRHPNPQPDRRSGPSRPYRGKPRYSEVATLFHDLGEFVLDLKVTELVVRMNERVEGVRYAGSYKWIDGEEGVPTLAVPGMFSARVATPFQCYSADGQRSRISGIHRGGLVSWL
jgi:hypothetical protein